MKGTKFDTNFHFDRKVNFILFGVILIGLSISAILFIWLHTHPVMSSPVVYVLPTIVPQPTPIPGEVQVNNDGTKTYISKEAGFSITFPKSYTTSLDCRNQTIMYCDNGSTWITLSTQDLELAVGKNGGTANSGAQITIAQGADTANNLLSNPTEHYLKGLKMRTDYSIIPSSLAIPADGIAIAYALDTDKTQSTERAVNINIFLFDKGKEYNGFQIWCQNAVGSGLCRRILPGLLSTLKIQSRFDKNSFQQ